MDFNIYMPTRIIGGKDCVLKNLKYLNIDSLNTIKRIMIAQLIGLSPLNNFGKFIGPITTGNGFYVGTEECDKFIINYKQAYQNPACCKILDENSRNLISVSIKNYPIIKAMDDNFMSDSLYYIIDGVIISRKRVMRNFEALIKNIDVLNISMYDLLYQAILYNMIDNVEHEKLEQIYDSICSMKINNNNKIYTLN